MKFGTGLNALLTAREARRYQRRVQYVAIGAFPLPLTETCQLNCDELLNTACLPGLHESPWECLVPVTPYVTLTKLAGMLQELQMEDRFHLIYYDAFAPSAQSER